MDTKPNCKKLMDTLIASTAAKHRARMRGPSGASKPLQNRTSRILAPFAAAVSLHVIVDNIGMP
jgi:hypothetical protein